MIHICYLQPHYKGEWRALSICKIGGSLKGKTPDSWVAASVSKDGVSEQFTLSASIYLPLMPSVWTGVEAPEVNSLPSMCAHEYSPSTEEMQADQ